MRIASLSVVAALGLGGCGGQSAQDNAGDFKGDQKAVAQVVDDLGKAGRKKDAKEICATVFARSLSRSLRNCTKVVDRQLADADSFDVDVQRVTVKGAAATATVKSTAGGKDRVQTLRFVRDGRAWRLAGLGR